MGGVLCCLCWGIFWVAPLKFKMSPEEGPFLKEISSSNYQFSGHVFVFGDVATSRMIVGRVQAIAVVTEAVCPQQWLTNTSNRVVLYVPGSKLPLFPYNRGWSSTQQ